MLAPGTVVAVAELGLRNDIYRRLSRDRPRACRARAQAGAVWTSAPAQATSRSRSPSSSGARAASMRSTATRCARDVGGDGGGCRRRGAGRRDNPGRGGSGPARTGRPRLLPFLAPARSEPRVVLARMASVLNPGGYLLVQEPVTSAGRIDGAADVDARSPAPRRRRALARTRARRSASSSSTPGPRRRPEPGPDPWPPTSRSSPRWTRNTPPSSCRPSSLSSAAGRRSFVVPVPSPQGRLAAPGPPGAKPGFSRRKTRSASRACPRSRCSTPTRLRRPRGTGRTKAASR